MTKHIPLNPQFESERVAVASSMELSEDSTTRFIGRQLRDLTYNMALRFRHNNQELWDRHLILDGMSEEEFRESKFN